MKNLPQKKRESGQTLIIILLVIAVSLVVGAGIATRSVSVVQQTTFAEEATQALHFAEAGAEDALGKIKAGEINRDTSFPCGALDCTGSDPCPPLDVNSDGSKDCCYEVSALANPFPGVVAQDDAVELKIGADFTCGEVKVSWCASDEGDNCSFGDGKPALEVIWVRDSEVVKEVYGSTLDGFTSPNPGGEVDDVDYTFEVTLSVDKDSDRAVRFIPRFGDSHIAVRPASGQPADCLGHQGYRILSEGTFGRSTRRIEVTKTEPAMPSIFDYSIFSGSEEPLEKR